MYFLHLIIRKNFCHACIFFVHDGNFGGNSYGPIIGPYLFLGKFVWTNGPESSSKVSPYTGIGPCMALPSWCGLPGRHSCGVCIESHQTWKIFSWPPPPPIFAKKMPPEYAIQWGSVWHKSQLKTRDCYRKCGIWTPRYGIQTPLLCHMNRFYWGWSIICWKRALSGSNATPGVSRNSCRATLV